MPSKPVLFGLLFICAACSSNEGSRVSLNQAAVTPDEFNIMPQRPLQQPSDYQTLPTPTPGEPNLADIDPMADLAAALGGAG